jgi:hexosaminidase
MRCAPVAGVLLAALAAPAVARTPGLDLVPWPSRVVAGTGVFAVAGRAAIVLDGADRAALDRLGRQAREIVQAATGLSPALTRTRRSGAITLRLLPASADTLLRESYTLIATPDSVVIAAPGEAGLFYGLQTLRQLVRTDGTIPAVAIADGPRFRWRGMHLDVGRHLFPVAFIERYLDLMARYKLNTFHWHLTEDQGWRLQIRRYPRLTDVGACRRETIVARNFDPYVGDGTPYCGFYTQDEVRHIVRYAAERHITVVPEIEMPGHSVAALAAYPELACTPGPFAVMTVWGVSDDILCPSETTFAFLENVLTEVMGLFPSTFIHIGGDEAPKARWHASPLAQEVMRREGLRTEEELQSWFIRRIERFLSAHGRRLVGWDEILEGGLAPNATVMSWRGTAGGIAAAQSGHDVVMSPTSHLYFDYAQGDARFEPLSGGGFIPLERVYAYEPVPDVLTPDQARHILGAQGNVWTEYMPTSAHVEYMALPRMLALAEVVWSPREARDWDRFVGRLPARLRELDALGVHYRIPGVIGLEEDRLTLADTVTVTLRPAVAAGTIRYTTDGTDPSPASPAYTTPFLLRPADTGTVVVARVFLENGRSSPPRAARFTRTSLRPAESVDAAALSPGLALRLLEGRAARVADVDAFAIRLDTVVPDVGLPPFAPDTSYALVFTGFVRIPETGIWRFRLGSDDGSVLWIGDGQVVDNDGLHGDQERSGQVALHAGLHPLRLVYFQRGGGRTLRLEASLGDQPSAPVTPLLVRLR